MKKIFLLVMILLSYNFSYSQQMVDYLYINEKSDPSPTVLKSGYNILFSSTTGQLRLYPHDYSSAVNVIQEDENGDASVTRDFSITRNLDVLGNTTLGNANSDSAIVRGLVTLTDSSATYPLTLGADCVIYRNAANVLKTDDSLIIDVDLTTNGNSILGNANSDTSTIRGLITFTDSSATYPLTLGADCVIYRNAANVLKTDDSLIIDTNLTVNGTTTANGNVTLGDANTDTVTINAGPINFVSSTSAADGLVIGTDTNLYRSAANTLSSDDIFTADNITYHSPGGNQNNGFGNNQFGSVTSAAYFNTAAGHGALSGITAGDHNTVGGYLAGSSIQGSTGIDGSRNSIWGSFSGDGITSGGANTIMGYDAGDTITTGDYCLVLGDSADVSTGDAQYQTAIGAGAVCTGNNQVRLGTSSETVSIPGSLTVDGNTTIGNAATDSLTINASSTVAMPNTNDRDDSVLIDGNTKVWGVTDATYGDELIVTDRVYILGNDITTGNGDQAVEYDEQILTIQNDGGAWIWAMAAGTYWDVDTSTQAVGTFSAFRSRGTTGSRTVVQDDDTLGVWSAFAYDGDSWWKAGAIEYQVDGSVSDGDVPSRLAFETNPGTSASAVEQMVIYSDGDVELTGDNNLTALGGDIDSGTDYWIDIPPYHFDSSWTHNGISFFWTNTTSGGYIYYRVPYLVPGTVIKQVRMKSYHNYTVDGVSATLYSRDESITGGGTTNKGGPSRNGVTGHQLTTTDITDVPVTEGHAYFVAVYKFATGGGPYDLDFYSVQLQIGNRHL